MVDKGLKKIYETTQKVFDRVEEGSSEDSPVDLPGTFKERGKDDPHRVVHKDPRRTSEPVDRVDDPSDPAN